LPANVGFGNFNVGFGNFQALGFGNSPLPGFGNSPPPGFGNCNVRFGNFQALGFGNFVVTARIRKLLRTLIRKLLGPNLKKSRRVPGKLEEHPASDVVALPEPNSFEFIRIKARLPGRNRQRIFQKQQYTHSYDLIFPTGFGGKIYPVISNRDKNSMKEEVVNWELPLHVGLWGGKFRK